MEVSALRYSGGISLHARSPLLRLQSDERLVTLVRRGSSAAFEVLVARYHARLLAFCRHLLGSREDAEDVLQEVLSAAFNAILSDDRPINVRPWLYRIARNRSLNHLRRIQAVGVDSMDIHLHDHGATTADKVHEREEFRLLVDDIQALPETQRTALVLREMDALSYEQIAEAMETTVPSVKSLLVRARVSLAESAEARMLTCEQVREELGEVAEGLQRRPGPLVRRHLRACERCSVFRAQLNETSKALTALLPIGPFILLRKLAILHIGHSAGAGAGSSASGATAAGQAAAVGSTAAAGATAVMGSTTTGFLSASVGAIATKAAAGLAAAALVTAGAVEVTQPTHHRGHARPSATTHLAAVSTTPTVASTTAATVVTHARVTAHRVAPVAHQDKPTPSKTTATTAHKPVDNLTSKDVASKDVASKNVASKDGTSKDGTSKDGTSKDGTASGKAELKTETKAIPTIPPGHTQTQTDATVLPTPAPAIATVPTATAGCPAPAVSPTTTTPASTTAPAATTTAPSPSSDPGSTQTSTVSTTAQTTPASSDPGTTTSSPSTSADTTSTTTVPASTGDASCAADSTGNAGAALAQSSGGAAP